MRVAGVAAYLDNFALIDLSKPAQATRRGRFVKALIKSSGSLLFSGTNCAELAALKGASASNVCAFLNEFGAHWVFVELDPGKIMEREAAGEIADACLSPELMHAFFKNRKTDLSNASAILDMSADTFFRLGAMMDWIRSHGAKMNQNTEALDKTIIKVVDRLWAEYESDPKLLDMRLPPIVFSEMRPATFVWNHLVRSLVTGAKGHPLKTGDGRDLCHAVVGAAYGSFAALDKHWKQRVEARPKPNGVAKIYYAPELNKLVDNLEIHAEAVA